MTISLGGMLRPDHVTVIAELSGNHNGSRERAIELVRAAHAAGADAVKLQTYTADTMTIDSDAPWFRIEGGTWAGRRLYDLYQEASTPWAWHPELFAEARRLGMPCFSTPFDDSAVAFLEGLDCPCYKIASFEVCDLPLIRRIAATGKPAILSTGMATLAEIDAAVRALRDGGCPEIALLACVSAYPARAEDMRLRRIPALADAFHCTVGLSDHSPGSTVAVAAVALGARVVEKHICLRRADGGPDASFSLEPEEFAALVRDVQAARAAVDGEPVFGAVGAELENLRFRRSLFVVRDVRAGQRLAAEDVRAIRPGHGLPPDDIGKVIGRLASRAIARGTPLTWDLLA